MKPSRPSISIAIVVMIFALSAVGFVVWQSSASSEAATGLKYRSLVNQAKRLAARGKTIEVEALCREAISVDDDRPDAYLLAAKCARSRTDYDQALKDLANVDRRHADLWLTAAMLKADILHYDAALLQQAEQVYLQILAVDKANVFAKSGYAKLLGLCGRRSDAIPLVLDLIQLGAAGDLLVLLSREEGAIADPELIERAIVANPDSAHPWLAKANLAILSLDHASAVTLLKTAISKQASDHATGRLGRQLMLASDADDLDQWAEELPDPSQWTAETWLVKGQLAEQINDVESAVRCYWEALRRWPESVIVTTRLATCLQHLGRSQQADVLRKRTTSLNRLGVAQQTAIMSQTAPTADDLQELVAAYAECGRLAEAFAWGQAAVRNFPDAAGLRQQFERVQDQLVGPFNQLTVAEFNVASQFDYSNFKIPVDVATVRKTENQSVLESIQFQRQASDIGFNFTYFNGCHSKSCRTFGLTGGGIAVFDLDADNLPDILCTQGAAWCDDVLPEAGWLEAGDQVFRNRAGESFTAVPPGQAILEEGDFGQGAAVGDINEDGFQDLYVANAKTNRLWVNNGDGTFSASKLTEDSNEPRGESESSTDSWTTSCLMADINGDGFADLYDVNYLAGDDVFTRICQQQDGQNIMCGPEAFEGAADRVLLNDGHGHFVDATDRFLQSAANGKGLGIVAFGQNDGRLNLFVANDTVANHFFVPVESDAKEEAVDEIQRPAGGKPIIRMMKDEAFVRGVAVNADGKSEACMGIAVADVNDDQRLDFIVTNFLHETNTLYQSITQELFQDQTRSLGLRDGTLPVLTFGTQFLDANNDGLQELFFANGYTQDLPGNDIPYAMRSQLFQWTGHQFQQLPADSVGAWGQQEFVARSVAKLDWNADGLPDLAVGLLHDASFLLTNQSEDLGETGVVLKLVATDSARDAIGASVTASINGKQQTVQLTAGDGYQCSNQRTVCLSGRRQAQIPKITIRWPSGLKQTFSDTVCGQHWVAVEGCSRLACISQKPD